jgi:hypothetical protein
VVVRRRGGKTVCAGGAHLAAVPGPSTSPLGAAFVIGRVFAILTAPVFLALFFFATTPAETQINAGLLWGGYYLLAHVFFWPPAFATGYFARRFRVYSPFNQAALMGVCSLIVTSIFAVVPTLVFNSRYTWHAGLRDAFTEAVAAAGGLVLYRALLGPGTRTSVGAAPNNRWRGP